MKQSTTEQLRIKIAMREQIWVGCNQKRDTPTTPLADGPDASARYGLGPHMVRALEAAMPNGSEQAIEGLPTDAVDAMIAAAGT